MDYIKHTTNEALVNVNDEEAAIKFLTMYKAYVNVEVAVEVAANAR